MQVGEWYEKYSNDDREIGFDEFFILPRFDIANGNLNAMEIYTLGIICLFAKPKRDKSKTIQTPPLSKKTIYDMSNFKSKKWQKEIDESIYSLRDKKVIASRRVDGDLFRYYVNISDGYIRINEDEYVKAIQYENSDIKKRNVVALYLALNGYMFKKPDTVASFVTWVTNETLAKLIGFEGNSTIKRAMVLLEDMKLIARFQVSRHNNAGTVRVLSCYSDRDLLTKFVKDRLGKDYLKVVE